MQLVFMGTPDFAVAVLDVLQAKHSIVAVYTQPPRSAGRGQQQRPSAVQIRAEALGLPVFTPRSLKKTDIQAEFIGHNADAAVVAAYGLILPQAVLDAPRLGCLNVHASLLPRWRGAAPIQRAIMGGDEQTGVTIMQMDAGLDTGTMLLKESVLIDDATTAGCLNDALVTLGARLIIAALDGLAAGTIEPTPQPNDGVTYANKIEKTEAAINFDRPARDVLRHIHGLSPFPGAYVKSDGERVKLLTVEITEDNGQVAAADPGTICDDRFTIACAEGAIRPKIVQRAGKGPTDTASFLRGFNLRPGARLG
jgi:methionyl-tRNA formyltransferase